MIHNILVLGKKGFGKSTWIRRHVFDNPNNIYLIYDHFKEYTPNDKDYFFTNTKIFSSIEDFISYYEGFDAENNPLPNGAYIFRGEIEYDEFFKLAYTLQNCTLVFDEIDLACSAQFTDEYLYKIINYGRHTNNKIISASRRPHNVSRNLSSQADVIICYRIVEPRDMKYIEEYCGFEIAERCQTLNVGEYIKYPPESEPNDPAR
jgi:hypothetical protein